jgi:hypothetical protein
MSGAASAMRLTLVVAIGEALFVCFTAPVLSGGQLGKSVAQLQQLFTTSGELGVLRRPPEVASSQQE